ncbi:Uu.00g043470.m01.CDS01 [Anthostomella pinea]|uniref:Uu.00g043470.m01.CDS01 n=1 Tax=Anthostomella pinea TaxID=933095 RepID=A0AAI8YBU0_9PEZI|nr:Uu.00g043470.m01.CDS01 [Anthostomella pinea]
MAGEYQEPEGPVDFSALHGLLGQVLEAHSYPYTAIQMGTSPDHTEDKIMLRIQAICDYHNACVKGRGNSWLKDYATHQPDMNRFREACVVLLQAREKLINIRLRRVARALFEQNHRAAGGSGYRPPTTTQLPEEHEDRSLRFVLRFAGKIDPNLEQAQPQGILMPKDFYHSIERKLGLAGYRMGMNPEALDKLFPLPPDIRQPGRGSVGDGTTNRSANSTVQTCALIPKAPTTGVILYACASRATLPRWSDPITCPTSTDDQPTQHAFPTCAS